MKKRYILNAYVASLIIAVALGVGTAYAANHILSTDEVTVDVIAHTPTPEPPGPASNPAPEDPAPQPSFRKISGPEGPSEVAQGEQVRYTVTYETDVIPTCDVQAPAHVDTFCKTYASEAEFGMQTDQPGTYTATLNLYVNASGG